MFLTFSIFSTGIWYVIIDKIRFWMIGPNFTRNYSGPKSYISFMKRTATNYQWLESIYQAVVAAVILGLISGAVVWVVF